MNTRLIAFTIAIALTFGTLSLLNTAPQVIATANAAPITPPRTLVVKSSPKLYSNDVSSSREHPTLLPTVYVTARADDDQEKSRAP